MIGIRCHNLAFAGALLLSRTIFAATLHVPADHPTIQSCIDAAVSGEDECVVAPGIYHETINLLGKAITVRSSHGIDVTIIDGTGMNDSVVHCVSSEGTDTVLRGFTITGGTGSGDPRRGGGLVILGGEPSIEDCVFVGNTAEYGGGVFAVSEWPLRPALTRCAFHLNTAYHGGGLYTWSAALSVSDSTFLENQAYRGGAVYDEAPYTGFEDRTTSIERCLFADNRALWNGGAIYVYEFGRPRLRDTRILNNQAVNGGGIFSYFASPLLSKCLLAGNFASDAGGGMRNLGSSAPYVADCLIEGNTAYSGGGMHNESECDPVIEHCSFIRNTATTKGGGVCSVGGATYVFRSSFQGNRAEQGGAVYDDMPRTTLGFFSSVFSGNVADDGGAVFLDTRGGYSFLDHCTFTRNSAIRGGAIYNRDYSSIIENCILWENQTEEIATEDSAAGSLYYTDLMGDRPPHLSDVAGNIDADPRFVRRPDPGADGAWGTEDDDYGDLHLRSDSPCIDAGDPALNPVPSPYRTDFDGHARFLCGRADMGAYEFGIGDYDCNQTVDLADFAEWKDCLSGPTSTPTLDASSSCAAFDFDGDGDVDLADFAGEQHLLQP